LQGRRIILDIRPECLRKLPWELIYEPPMRLARDPSNPLVRGPINLDHPQDPADNQIRILVVVGCKPNDPEVRPDEELPALEEAFWKLEPAVEYRIVEQPSPATLRAAFRLFPPHILHFIGHGRLSDKSPPALEMWNAEQQPPTRWFWDFRDMAGDLAGRAPQLAFLNACHSQEAPDQEGLWSIGDTLISPQVGTHAVLGMQGAIAGVAAARCAVKVYTALFEQQPLDVALARARGEVAALHGEVPRNWSLPVLRMAVPPDHLLPLPWGVVKPLLVQFRRIREF
jgi:hypothetical protein